MAMSGSEIAKGGFRNEDDVVEKFNNWQQDAEAQEWLKTMMYNIDDISSVEAQKIGQKGYKSDIFIKIKVRVPKKNKIEIVENLENVQVKLVSNGKGFNQVEKKKVEAYVKQWHMDEETIRLLKLFDGETPPPPSPNRQHERRMFANEFTEDEQAHLTDFFQRNMIMIISDVIRGRGRYAAEWTLVVNKYNNQYNCKLIAVNEAIDIYAGDYKAEITQKGSFHLGNITLQRKGGDKGADSANMLQFKADPMILFNHK